MYAIDYALDPSDRRRNCNLRAGYLPAHLPPHAAAACADVGIWGPSGHVASSVVPNLQDGDAHGAIQLGADGHSDLTGCLAYPSLSRRDVCPFSMYVKPARYLVMKVTG